jgi:hypothetical protein
MQQWMFFPYTYISITQWDKTTWRLSVKHTKRSTYGDIYIPRNFPVQVPINTQETKGNSDGSFHKDTSLAISMHNI